MTGVQTCALPIYQREGKERSSGASRHIKAALIHNHWRIKNKLEKVFPEIKDNDKMKWLSLLPGNPINQDVIGFKDQLPEGFGLHDWIDRDAMFESTFQHAVEKMATRVGWKLKEVVSAADIFGW